MPSRINTNLIETKSRDKVRTIIDNYGNALFRDFTERDYGIDALIELFNNGNPTGKFALLQLKATEKTIVPNKNNSYVSVKGISMANAQYAFQKNIPVILIYVSIKENAGFYYADIQSIVNESIITKLNQNSSGETTLRIPVDNYITDDITPLITLIESYYV
ncbi:MAG: DUF4365 domain-containing protein [Ruminococcus sp.]|nr:DUF4365 domain-containing protein [Ruminococcus sp.]